MNRSKSEPEFPSLGHWLCIDIPMPIYYACTHIPVNTIYPYLFWWNPCFCCYPQPNTLKILWVYALPVMEFVDGGNQHLSQKKKVYSWAKLVNITPITKIYDTHNYKYSNYSWGLQTNKHHWEALHCRLICKNWLVISLSFFSKGN
jgi:hypothetical protein